MIEKGLYESYRNNLILKNIEMAFLCMHWGYYENADKDMKRIVFLASISKPDALQKTREIIIQSNSTSAVCTSIFSISGN